MYANILVVIVNKVTMEEDRRSHLPLMAIESIAVLNLTNFKNVTGLARATVPTTLVQIKTEKTMEVLNS